MRTLRADAEHECLIKKSRFLARAARADTADEAMAFLQRVRDDTASHNCWAYRIGELYRFSDDGEPGGTAGRPILSAIEGQRVDHVMVVVARHFGGIKLGAGGLVRAYGGTAA
ncbi:MAG: YigZ family protein, partial [Polyangiaceae bacterium]|nr:YigZ family protein [Polyangiaceae bacterium]